MDKKLQDLAWSVLSKEFKEEVKKYYQRVCRYDNLYSARGAAEILELLFGKHNLTSDAEGEELLTVKAKTVREMYAANERLKASFPGTIAEADADKINHILRHLFGSKCLPDEEPKPAEPKYKMGDIVRFKYGCTPYRIDGFKMSEGAMLYQVGEVWAAASDIEPYTEPEEPTCTDTCTDDCPSQSRNLSQETANCDKCNDRRLHIAAMVMPGIMSASDPLMFSERGCLSAEAIARQALKYAVALIAEAEKGGAVGNF